MSSNIPIHGHCDPAFADVKAAFTENFETRGEVGASCTVIADGRKVVDLWGGYKDAAKTQDWEEDTLSIVFSCTKAAVALCAHILIDRGQLDLDAKVTDYWPEFGANGKEATTVRMMLGHQSGVPALREPVKPDGFYDFDYMCERLAAEEPFWEIGPENGCQGNGYHMHSFGWTVGGLVTRVSGLSLGEFFKREIAGPLGLDFHIGLPESENARVAHMIGADMTPADLAQPFYQKLFSDPTSIQHLCLMNVGGHYHDKPEAWAAQIGGSGGISNARAIAGMYAPLVREGAYLSRARIDDMRKPLSETDHDHTLLIPSRFGQGFMLSMDNRDTHPGEGNSVILGEGAFGHVGAGGSIGFADPDAGLAFGYTMTKMGAGILLSGRGQALVDAAYGCL